MWYHILRQTHYEDLKYSKFKKNYTAHFTVIQSALCVNDALSYSIWSSSNSANRANIIFSEH